MCLRAARPPLRTGLPTSSSTTCGDYGRTFFPDLISGPFGKGLHLAFLSAAGLCFIGAVFSWLRGPGQSEVMQSAAEDAEEGLAAVGAVAMAEVGA